MPVDCNSDEPAATAPVRPRVARSGSRKQFRTSGRRVARCSAATVLRPARCSDPHTAAPARWSAATQSRPARWLRPACAVPRSGPPARSRHHPAEIDPSQTQHLPGRSTVSGAGHARARHRVTDPTMRRATERSTGRGQRRHGQAVVSCSTKCRRPMSGLDAHAQPARGKLDPMHCPTYRSTPAGVT